MANCLHLLPEQSGRIDTHITARLDHIQFTVLVIHLYQISTGIEYRIGVAINYDYYSTILM